MNLNICSKYRENFEGILGNPDVNFEGSEVSSAQCAYE